eukprot:TRINITY_DN2653_c0_g1_i4.p1 TRINITY_DN2653_c0_g1~~TRINITY_DN2653_c0_g1_i4.p1  ORF type:complete len:194 (-),score=20.80 TRINITY_DN2653_c0_g1_i4:12-593(-)
MGELVPDSDTRKLLAKVFCAAAVLACAGICCEGLGEWNVLRLLWLLVGTALRVVEFLLTCMTFVREVPNITKSCVLSATKNTLYKPTVPSHAGFPLPEGVKPIGRAPDDGLRNTAGVPPRAMLVGRSGLPKQPPSPRAHRCHQLGAAAAALCGVCLLLWRVSPAALPYLLHAGAFAGLVRLCKLAKEAGALAQ